ncbi:MAG: universal stress protein UspA [Anaerovoracaceae bacterium]
MLNVMVCVTSQKNCERLINFGKDLLKEQEGNLLIIHIAHYEFQLIGKTEEGEALEYLYEKALECGANLTVVRSNNVLATLADMVEKNQIDEIVLGESPEMNSTKNIVKNLSEKITNANINVVSSNI